MTPIDLFSLVMLLTSSVLCVWHVKTWETIKAANPVGYELDFAWRQARRRIKASGMLAVVGIAAFFSQFMDAVPRMAVWLVVLLLVLWMMLLAVADILAIRRHFGRQHSGQLAEQAGVRAEIEQIIKKHRPEANDRDAV